MPPDGILHLAVGGSIHADWKVTCAPGTFGMGRPKLLNPHSSEIMVAVVTTQAKL